MGTYLRRWGLSFQRPDKRAVEQDPEAVRVWQEETWPAIRAKAKAEGGEVLFADQVGIRSDQVTGRTWGAKGCTSIVRRSGNRFSVNAMSAISPKGRMHFMVFTETFEADVMCRFLNRLAGPFDRKVHLVVDGHSAHPARSAPGRPITRPDRAALSAVVLAGAEPRRAGERRPQTKPSDAQPGPGTRPNSPPGPAGSSTAVKASRTSSAATAAADTTSSNGTLRVSGQ
ncbi:transposase [Streptomyces pseudogriseolus]|uniref:transposase n=1 Tax=Streptomyces pseudogriseolus TaxID=36817 RepID=UPI003FA25F7B